MTQAYPIPAAALDDRLGIVGTSGSGKTYLMLAAVERLLARRDRVVIPDPLGVCWGLRLMADGKTPSKFPVVIFGGPHGDLPLTEHSGALVGEAVAGMAESCILDLSELGTKAAERRFMLAFLTALYRKATGEPVHLIFDEADMWAPQKLMDKDGDAARLLGQMETIVRRGRVKGFIPWLITQRPAVLNKDVLSQVDGLVAMKLTSSQDRAALEGWIEGSADKGQAREILGALPSMELGQGVVWIPGRGVLTTSKFPAKATFDSSRTPKRGEKRQAPTLKPLDVEALKGRLATVEQEVAAQDPRKLKARILELELMVRKLDKAKGPAIPVSLVALEKAEAKGYARGKIDGAAEAHNLNRQTMLDLVAGWSAALDAAAAALGDLSRGIKTTRKDLERAPKKYPVNGVVKSPAMLEPPDAKVETIDLDGVTSLDHAIRLGRSTMLRDAMEEQKPKIVSAFRAAVKKAVGELGGPSGASLKILGAIALWERLGFKTPTRAQVCGVAGIQVGGSTMRARLAELRAADLVRDEGGGNLGLTTEGRRVAPEPPEGSVWELVRGQLGNASEAIVQWLLEVGGSATREQVAAAVSIELNGSTMRARLAELRKLQLIEDVDKSTIKVQAWLADNWGRGA